MFTYTYCNQTRLKQRDNIQWHPLFFIGYKFKVSKHFYFNTEVLLFIQFKNSCIVRVYKNNYQLFLQTKHLNNIQSNIYKVKEQVDKNNSYNFDTSFQTIRLLFKKVLSYPQSLMFRKIKHERIQLSKVSLIKQCFLETLGCVWLERRTQSKFRFFFQSI